MVWPPLGVTGHIIAAFSASRLSHCLPQTFFFSTVKIKESLGDEGMAQSFGTSRWQQEHAEKAFLAQAGGRLGELHSFQWILYLSFIFGERKVYVTIRG